MTFPKKKDATMLRLSVAAGLSLLGIVLPIARGSRPASETKPVIPPNAVGTWRLDSLIDQAVVTGVAAESLDPASFVSHELAFDGDIGAIVPLNTTYGEASVSSSEGVARLGVKGQAGAFLLRFPRTALANIGAFVWKVRSTNCGEVALIRDRATIDTLKGMAVGPGGPGGRAFGRPGGGNFGAPPAGAPAGVAPAAAPPAPAGAPPQGVPSPAPAQNAGSGGVAVQPAGAAAGVPPPVPGGAIPGFGNLAGFGGFGGFGGPGGFGGVDPRQMLSGQLTSFSSDGAWHTLLKKGTDTAPPGMGGMMFGGGSNPQRDIEEVLLVVLPKADDAVPAAAASTDPVGASTEPTPSGEPPAAESPAGAAPVAAKPVAPPAAGPGGARPSGPPATAELDLEFLHVLDSKADYAGATVAPVTLQRGRVHHGGLHLNTPASVIWRLVAPQGARLIAGLGALNEQPFDLYVHVSSKQGRETVFRHAFDPPLDLDGDPKHGIPAFNQEAVVPVSVDLSAYAGQEIALEVEVIEQAEPNVAFLLQPLIHGARQAGVRNVMLYFCDTLRADGLSCYGNSRPTSPNLDALADSGIRFERCFSQGAWTYVSMPSSLTSLWPSVSGVKTGGERIPGSATTMAEAFREAGYLTAAFIRNDFVGPTTHTEQGFDFFFPGDVNGAPPNAPGGGGAAVVAAAQRMFGPQRPQMADAGAGGMNFSSGSSRDLWAKVEPWLEQYSDVPFLVYMHAVDPHEPYEPEEADRAKFMSTAEWQAMKDAERKYQTFQLEKQRKAQEAAAAAGGQAAPFGQFGGFGGGIPIGGGGVTDIAASYREAGVDPDDYYKVKTRTLYDAEVHYLDRHYQKVRDWFEARGLTDSTIWSFNSDHGDEFLEHGRLSHGQSAYSELIHVPWILSAPGLVPAGTTIRDNVANLDLAPTLLGLAGVAVPETMQGRNLAPELLAGEELPPKMIVTELWGGGFAGAFGNGLQGGDADDFLGEWAVIEGRWKTIARRSKPAAEIKLDLEIYDLDSDMDDVTSMIEAERPRAEASAKRLEHWLGEMKQIATRYAGEDTVSDNAMEMMRALGYAK
jgi:arylsulfatase A-like enzyme